jgi:hypothetical protein
MKFQQLRSILFFTFVFVSIAGCGVNHTTTPISVQWATGFVPPASIDTGAYAGLAAAVSNDPKSQGVTFSCAPAGSCGTFTPAAIASAVPTCYLAPAQIPATNPVTVTATSMSDTTKFISAQITIESGPAQACP